MNKTYHLLQSQLLNWGVACEQNGPCGRKGVEEGDARLETCLVKGETDKNSSIGYNA
jgi:hypothetical protein